MQMVRFGADQILSGKGGTYTDQDIDALIAKGEEKTSQMQAKFQTNAQHSLAPPVHNSRSLMSSERTCKQLLRTADLLATQLQEEKEKLHKEAFPDWNTNYFKCFCSSLERHGRFNVDNVAKDVAHECAKDEADVKRYFVAFWTGYKRIADWKKILERIERGEKKIIRMKQITEAIREK